MSDPRQADLFDRSEAHIEFIKKLANELGEARAEIARLKEMTGAIRRDALEEAMAVCRNAEKNASNMELSHLRVGFMNGCIVCGDAIRALILPEPPAAADGHLSLPADDGGGK